MTDRQLDTIMFFLLSSLKVVEVKSVDSNLILHDNLSHSVETHEKTHFTIEFIR